MRASFRFLAILLAYLGSLGPAMAHPLGNFTINQLARIDVGETRLRVHHLVDMAEIPSFQEISRLDRDGDRHLSVEEAQDPARAQGERIAAEWVLFLDDRRLALTLESARLWESPGESGAPTLRAEYILGADLPPLGAAAHRVRVRNASYEGRVGWTELVVGAERGLRIFDSSIFADSRSDGLRHYPGEASEPVSHEREGVFSMTRGALPGGALPLRQRDGSTPSSDKADPFVALMNADTSHPLGFLLAMGLAVLLGGLHALSPGHGKTVVAAYLVGDRGTAAHAVFLGMTVTVTHTLGVFVLGAVTLFASRYVLPESILPWLSVASGTLVLGLGLSLLAGRIRASWRGAAPHPVSSVDAHSPGLSHAPCHPHDDVHEHHHAHEHPAHELEHGPSHDHQHGHSHLPPGADGTPVTWKSLLALGVAGGIVPCPSALVVLLAAIAMHRIAFGLLLIVAFSAGLAAVLTGVGLAFVHAKARLRPWVPGRMVGLVPLASAALITGIGAILTARGLEETGFLASLGFAGRHASWDFASHLSVLGIGLLFGLKHAFDADHLAAVSTLVSERRGWWRSSLVGAVWGLGHTLALLAVGVAVVVFQVRVDDGTAHWLEMVVALMLIWLGLGALWRVVRGGLHLHAHAHAHGEHRHVHPHAHVSAPSTHSHHEPIGVRPLVIGLLHGLAGSAALMLLVLTTIPSPTLGFLYIGVFGLGSIGGMALMSLLLSLPLSLTAERFDGAYATLRVAAALLSLGIGSSMAYELGFATPWPWAG